MVIYLSFHGEPLPPGLSITVIYYQMPFCTKRFIQASNSVIGSWCKGSVDICKQGIFFLHTQLLPQKHDHCLELMPCGGLEYIVLHNRR